MTFSKSLTTDRLSATAVKAAANSAQALKSTTVDFDRVNVGVATEDNQFLGNDIEECQKLKKEISKLQKDTRNLNTLIQEAKKNGNKKEQNRLLQEKICIQNEFKIKQEKLNKLLIANGSLNQNTQLKNNLSDRRVTDDNPTSTLDLAALSGFVKNLGIATVGLVVGFGAMQGQAHATSFNMIENGEFEDIVGDELRNSSRNLHCTQYRWGRCRRGYYETNQWDYASELQGSDWEVSDAYTRHSYLKQQGYYQVESKGSDGFDTGNFFAGHSTQSNISQTFTLGDNIDTSALFSFDLAEHTSSRNSYVDVSIIGNNGREILSEKIDANNTSWKEYKFDFDVIAGEQIKVNFDGWGSVAIDDVEFIVNEKGFKAAKRKVPEPTSILGLAAISGLAASSLKRKRKSSNI